MDRGRKGGGQVMTAEGISEHGEGNWCRQDGHGWHLTSVQEILSAALEP